MLRVAVIAVALSCAAPAFAQTPTVSIALHDHQFSPAEVTAPAGVKVRLIVKNQQKVNAEFESSSLHREKIVTAGGTITVFVGPLTAGSYEFFDDFHPATRGHLVVK
jgi:plastocyanin